VTLGIRVGAAALAALGLVAAGCGDVVGGERSGRPLVSDIAAGVDALEEMLGRSPDYFEMRATPLSVTLWVSADDGRRAIPYVYADGELADPDAAQQVDPGGFTFAAEDALTFDAETIFEQVEADLDDPALTEFSILAGANGAIRLGVVVQSSRGGRLDIRLAPGGEVLEAVPID